MTTVTKSPLYRARSAGRTAQVAIVIGDEYPDVVWRPACVGCGAATTHVERRSGSVSRVEGRVRTTRTLTLPVPLCEACAARDRKAQATMLGVSIAVGVLVAAGAWHAMGVGALAIGLVAFLAASAVALAVGPAPSLGIAPTMGGQVVLSFRRREAARELIEANAADEKEARELLDELGGGG
jgi:hypothetical protein